MFSQQRQYKKTGEQTREIGKKNKIKILSTKALSCLASQDCFRVHYKFHTIFSFFSNTEFVFPLTIINVPRYFIIAMDATNLRHTGEGKGNLNQYFKYEKIFVLRSSGISRKSGALIVRHSQKGECISFVFYCFENLSTVITLEPLARFRWCFSKMYLS